MVSDHDLNGDSCLLLRMPESLAKECLSQLIEANKAEQSIGSQRVLFLLPTVEGIGCLGGSAR